jgi:hypothetical protein
MKIHLIKTPEYTTEYFKEVYEFDINNFPFLKEFNPDSKFKHESDLKKLNFEKDI